MRPRVSSPHNRKCVTYLSLPVDEQVMFIKTELRERRDAKNGDGK